MKILFEVYQIFWTAFFPLLLLYPRLRTSLKERISFGKKERYDLWIHSASAGEAFLVLEIIKYLKDLRLILTTNTPQGKQILQKTNLPVRYLPFDMPFIMEKVFKRWRPRLLVLVETELWPALLYTAKRYHIPVIVINGRISERSFRFYVKFRSIWRKIAPKAIYAVSCEDAKRFGLVFGMEKVSVMNNIKFDRIKPVEEKIEKRLRNIIPEDSSFVVFGSIRKEEEEEVSKVIKGLFSIFPDLIVSVFPRHMERISFWKGFFERSKINYALRSAIKTYVKKGTAIVWDVFGELSSAYSIADAVFVGGSLKPCGGHNFLEPLSCGIIPCVGPFLDNFRWIGNEIFDMGLVIKVKDWKDLLRKISYQLLEKKDRKKIREKFFGYINSKKGGAKEAALLIKNYLNMEVL